MRVQTQSLSRVRLCATLWAVAALLSMEFSKQEYWSGLPFPPPGEASQSREGTGVSCVSCIDRQILYHSPTWEAPTLDLSQKARKQRRYTKSGSLVKLFEDEVLSEAKLSWLLGIRSNKFPLFLMPIWVHFFCQLKPKIPFIFIFVLTLYFRVLTFYPRNFFSKRNSIQANKI